MRRQFLLSVVALGAAAALPGCWGGGSDAGTVADEVAANSDLQTLEEALAATGLAASLDGSTLNTLFAPTNAAFEALYAELGLTKDELFADTELLTAVLSYHVVSGEVSAAEVPLGSPITPLDGGYFKITSEDGQLIVQDGRNRLTNIVQADKEASNGVIHVVDRVLLPADRDVVATAIALPGFGTLVEALIAADLVTTLQGPGPFTVFAPNDAAFDALFVELGITKEELFADVPLLTSVLTYHVLASLTLAADIPFDTAIPTLQGDTFSISEAYVITDANGRTSNIITADVFASNGVIHAIDRVLLPITQD